jgi:hypothetical protein
MHGLGSILLGLRTRRRSSGGRRIGFTIVNVLWGWFGVSGGGYRIVAVGFGGIVEFSIGFCPQKSGTSKFEVEKIRAITW